VTIAKDSAGHHSCFLAWRLSASFKEGFLRGLACASELFEPRRRRTRVSEVESMRSDWIRVGGAIRHVLAREGARHSGNR